MLKPFFSKSYNIFAIAMFLIIAVSLIIPPICAVPDAGEYFGTFSRAGFYNVSEYSVSLSYGLSTPEAENPTFFESFLMGVASINKLLYSNEVFDIRFLSGIYMLIFLAAVYFFLKNMYTESNIINYTLGAVMLIFFCDLGYISYFNSFYASALNLVLVFSLLSLAVSMRKSFKWWKIILFTLFSVAYIFTMYQNFVIGLAIAVSMAVFAIKREGAQRVIGIICAIILLGTSVLASGVVYPTKNEGIFNSVYFGVLEINPDADKAMQELGIEGNEHLIGKTSYDAEASDIDTVSHLGYGDIISYYIKNPNVLLLQMDNTAKNSYFLVQDFLDYNHVKFIPLRLWDFLKRRVLPQGLWIILIYAIAFLVMAVKEYIKKGGAYIFAIALPIAMLTEFFFSFIASGMVLISKNLFSYGMYLDIMLMLTIVWGIDTVMKNHKNIKEKYGVNQ